MDKCNDFGGSLLESYNSKSRAAISSIENEKGRDANWEIVSFEGFGEKWISLKIYREI